MAQTGTGHARAKKVFRARLGDLWSEGSIWWPWDADFVPPQHTSAPSEPASFLRVQPGPLFSETPTWNGAASFGQSTVSLLFAVQVRPGMEAELERAEAEIRAIADPDQNVHDEQVWTSGAVEIHENIAPQVPASVQEGYYWTQFVIPYELAEGF